MKIIWFDDDSERMLSAQRLESNIDIPVVFRSLSGRNLIEEIQWFIREGGEPDLILLDHSLDRAIDSTLRTGSSFAAVIREIQPSCPIVCITGADFDDIDIRHKEAYEIMIKYPSLGQHHEFIRDIAHGFRNLKSRYSNLSTNTLIELLKCPQSDIDKIQKIIPRSLKENLNDPTVLLEFFRWVENVLFYRPGFLYNELWTSTFIGLNLEGFKKVRNTFDDALYNGVFATRNRPRWWKSDVLDILNKYSNEYDLPWKIGRLLLPDNPEDYSKCYLSGEDFPETVAQEDSTEDSPWHPMKLKYTIPHTKFEDLLFFENIRMMGEYENK